MRNYSQEYKNEAVQLVFSRGNKIKETARELGISPWTLKEWVEKHRTKLNADKLASGSLSLEEENKLLRKELENVREEHEILKKAIAVFSQKPKKNIHF